MPTPDKAMQIEAMLSEVRGLPTEAEQIVSLNRQLKSLYAAFCAMERERDDLLHAAKLLALSITNEILECSREEGGHTNIAVVKSWRKEVLKQVAALTVAPPPQEQKCHACNGVGGGENRMGGPEWTCTVCSGTGRVAPPQEQPQEKPRFRVGDRVFYVLPRSPKVGRPEVVRHLGTVRIVKGRYITVKIDTWDRVRTTSARFLEPADSVAPPPQEQRYACLACSEAAGWRCVNAGPHVTHPIGTVCPRSSPPQEQPQESDEQFVRTFIGWLSADIPQLHHVEVPRLADSWERFKRRMAEPASLTVQEGGKLWTK